MCWNVIGRVSALQKACNSASAHVGKYKAGRNLISLEWPVLLALQSLCLPFIAGFWAIPVTPEKAKAPEQWAVRTPVWPFSTYFWCAPPVSRLPFILSGPSAHGLCVGCSVVAGQGQRVWPQRKQFTEIKGSTDPGLKRFRSTIQMCLELQPPARLVTLLWKSYAP